MEAKMISPSQNHQSIAPDKTCYLRLMVEYTNQPEVTCDFKPNRPGSHYWGVSAIKVTGHMCMYSFVTHNLESATVGCPSLPKGEVRDL